MKHIYSITWTVGCTVLLISIMMLLVNLFVGRLELGFILTGVMGYVLMYLSSSAWDNIPIPSPKMRVREMTEEELIAEGISNQFKKLIK